MKEIIVENYWDNHRVIDALFGIGLIYAIGFFAGSPKTYGNGVAFGTLATIMFFVLPGIVWKLTTFTTKYKIRKIK